MRLPSLQTSFVGQQFHFLPQCASTNAEAHAALVKNGATAEGLTILADHQTAGRGQRGNAWQAPPGQNLTFSVVLRPTFLAATEQFALSIAVALACHDALRVVLPPAATATARIKWPNDLYLADRKVGGILIENTLRGAQLGGSIVGIGLNVNQRDFDPALPNPTSLAVAADRAFDRAAVLTSLLTHLEARYLALRGGAARAQRTDYLAQLYRFGEVARFAFADGRPTAAGRITGLDSRGQLLIALSGAEYAFSIHEVRFAE
ncbi:MAG: biotin--[acetyl-CoA-carboxylase] ligase [Hymenobacteraceae bacterium]|nr:biotin--[acetyl-CoA-carboxylase] ligase [Hymenobacteraceae bacterium]